VRELVNRQVLVLSKRFSTETGEGALAGVRADVTVNVRANVRLIRRRSLAVTAEVDPRSGRHQKVPTPHATAQHLDGSLLIKSKNRSKTSRLPFATAYRRTQLMVDLVDFKDHMHFSHFSSLEPKVFRTLELSLAICTSETVSQLGTPITDAFNKGSPHLVVFNYLHFVTNNGQLTRNRKRIRKLL
jgi:hypothetical protein